MTSPIFHTAIHPCGEVQYVSNHEHNSHSFYLSFIVLLFIDTHIHSESKDQLDQTPRRTWGNLLNSTILPLSANLIFISAATTTTQGHYGVSTPVLLRYFKITLPSRTYSFTHFMLCLFLLLSSCVEFSFFFFIEGTLQASNILLSQPAFCLHIMVSAIH